MPEAMPFAATVVDQSNTAGFQFEFHCLRCGTAYSSHFHALSALAADAGGTALKKAGGMLGNRAGKMFESIGDYVGDRAADVVKDEVKERAFQAAVHEVAPQFILCPHCRRWVCRPRCFNAAAGLCQDCALQGGSARPPASLPASVPPPPGNVASPPQLMYPGHASPPAQPPYSGYPSPAGQPPNMGYGRPPAQPPLPGYGLPPEQTPYPGYPAPPGQNPYPGYATPPPPLQPSPELPPVNPGYAPPTRSPTPGHAPAPPLQLHVRASRHHPGTVSVVVVDADDQVVAALHLDPDDVRDLADDLVSAAETAMAMQRMADRH